MLDTVRRMLVTETLEEQESFINELLPSNDGKSFSAAIAKLTGQTMNQGDAPGLLARVKSTMPAKDAPVKQTIVNPKHAPNKRNGFGKALGQFLIKDMLALGDAMTVSAGKGHVANKGANLSTRMEADKSGKSAPSSNEAPKGALTYRTCPPEKGRDKGTNRQASAQYDLAGRPMKGQIQEAMKIDPKFTDVHMQKEFQLMQKYEDAEVKMVLEIQLYLQYFKNYRDKCHPWCECFILPWLLNLSAHAKLSHAPIRANPSHSPCLALPVCRPRCAGTVGSGPVQSVSQEP